MDYWHKKWQCPFFVWDDRSLVACEGKCRIIFPDDVAAREFMEGYCASLSGWESCAIAANKLRFYERQEQAEQNARRASRKPEKRADARP